MTKLTEEEFRANINQFNALEIKTYTEVEGKDYQVLSEFLKKQHRKLILVTHPDKGGTKERFSKIHKAYNNLKEYIKPLESGKPCVAVSFDDKCNGHLTAREFHYRKKLFDALNIGEEAIGKNFNQLISMIKEKEKDKSIAVKLSILSFYAVNNPQKHDELLSKLLSEFPSKPSIQLYLYIHPLSQKSDLIKEDKQALAQKLIERKNALLFISAISIIPLAVLNFITIGCYFSWWIIAFDIVTGTASKSLENHYVKKYVKEEISTDEFISKINYITLGIKLFMTYPMAAFSVYLLTKNFIDNGLTVGGAILGPLFLLAILIEVLAPIFAKGCEIYTEKHIKDLLKESQQDKVQKETDLLNWYDPRKLLMFFIMPIVQKCFAKLANEFSERNFNEMSTDKVNADASDKFSEKNCHAAKTNVSDVDTTQQFNRTLLVN